MKIVFTKHADFKLLQRGIARQSVAETLSSPDFILPAYGDRRVAYKKFGRLLLAVIFREEKKSYIVITQHWVVKASKSE